MMLRIRLLVALLASASAEPSDCQASGFDPETHGATCSLLLQTNVEGGSKSQGGFHEDAHRSQSFSSTPECIALAAATAAYRWDWYHAGEGGYAESGKSAANKLGELGYNFVNWFSTVSGNWDHDYASLWAKDGACLLNFKGSDASEDFVNNENSVQTTKWGLSGVHSGLVAELEPLVNKMDFAAIRGNCTGSLTVTGHSLGGGLAQLFALAINNPADPLGAQLTVDFLYTFGTMPVSISELPNPAADDGCFAGGLYLTSLKIQDATVPVQVDVLLDPVYGGGMLPVPTTKTLLFGPDPAPMVYDCATPLPATVGPIPTADANGKPASNKQWWALHEPKTYAKFMGCSA